MNKFLTAMFAGFLGALLFTAIPSSALDPLLGFVLRRLDGSQVGQSSYLRVTDGFIQPGYNGQELTLGAGPQVVLDADSNGCYDGTDNGLCSTLHLQAHTVYSPTQDSTCPSGACTTGDTKICTAAATGSALYICENTDGAPTTSGTWVRQGRVVTGVATMDGLVATNGTTEYFRYMGDTKSSDALDTTTSLRSQIFDQMTFWAMCCTLDSAPVGSSVRTFTLETNTNVSLLSIALSGSEFTECTKTESGATPAGTTEIRLKEVVSGASAFAASDATCGWWATIPSSAGL